MPQNNTDTPLVEMRQVSKWYHGHKVLDHVNIAVQPREVLTVVGLNGSGKTTLLRVLMGLTQPDEGEVIRRQGLRMGYMPQRVALDPVLPLTVEYLLNLYARQKDTAKLIALCEELEISHALKQSIHQLSGGEFQRVLLARALLSEPELLILDEPVQGVDISGQAKFYRLIAEITRRRQCATLMVSHELHLVMSACDRVICLNHHVCCAGHPQQVSRDPSFLALFGPEVAESIAIYAHHHDHTHDLTGEVERHHG